MYELITGDVACAALRLGCFSALSMQAAEGCRGYFTLRGDM